MDPGGRPTQDHLCPLPQPASDWVGTDFVCPECGTLWRAVPHEVPPPGRHVRVDARWIAPVPWQRPARRATVIDLPSRSRRHGDRRPAEGTG